MKFKEFMEMYDNWNGNTKVNDNNLNPIVEGSTESIMNRLRTDLLGVNLFEMEVVAFGFYDNTLCVRVK